MLYGASAWFCSQGGYGLKMREKYTIRRLAAIQHRANTAASGAFRTTAVGALCIELCSKPIAQRLTERVLQEGARIVTGPSYHTILQARVDHAHPARASPLEKLEKKLADRNLPPEQLETRTPYNLAPWEKPIHT
ncbi:hypothetical protein CLCR_04428 [Cladophialophora carrionii]|uniref:Uncharacterized protein n=1 Tax=Cladophialophora carrionii TaxID=86049 RepID=A0A1C1CJG3_9EURO|nr:hypothetical protein CLCR_04428 [Cladophialophora carrionii]